MEFVRGDLFQSTAQAIVNPVNCVGVMGKGLALQFKKAYPANFRAYAAACKNREVQPGKLLVFQESGRIIVNLPTKRHWRDSSRIEDIESGLAALADFLGEASVRSVAIPALGAGLGGLDWSEVRVRIEWALASLRDIEVVVYEPAS